MIGKRLGVLREELPQHEQLRYNEVKTLVAMDGGQREAAAACAAAAAARLCGTLARSVPAVQMPAVQIKGGAAAAAQAKRNGKTGALAARQRSTWERPWLQRQASSQARSEQHCTQRQGCTTSVKSAQGACMQGNSAQGSMVPCTDIIPRCQKSQLHSHKHCTREVQGGKE